MNIPTAFTTRLQLHLFEDSIKSIGRDRKFLFRTAGELHDFLVCFVPDAWLVPDRLCARGTGAHWSWFLMAGGEEGGRPAKIGHVHLYNLDRIVDANRYQS